jgi:hypothetical protein
VSFHFLAPFIHWKLSFLHCCHVRLFDSFFTKFFFGEVKRRWQAFSSGLGSLSFPVFWPVIDIITGCLLFGSICLF